MKTPILLFCACSLVAACSTDPRLGGASNFATGGATGSSASGSNPQLAHCARPMGTLAIQENQAAPWYGYLTSQYRLQSTVPVLRMIVQQSNCFVVVERGGAMNNMMMERGLAQSGELRSTSRMGKGQIVAADYTMSPSINFSQRGASGFGAAAGLIPVVGGALGGVAANTRANDASTTLLLIDNRSGVQLSASEGSARNWDVGGLGGLFGAGGGGVAGGYSRTPEGRVLTAAFMDSYNQMVTSLQGYQAQKVEGGLGAGGTLGVDGGSTLSSRRIR